MFKRLLALLKGFLSIFVGNMEKNNPEALLSAEKDKLRKQIGDFNAGLAAHAGMVETLMGQVKALQKQEVELKAKTTALLKAGQNEAAAEYALRYKNVDAQEDDLRAQLEDAELRYKELVKARDVAIKSAREKIDQITQGMNEVKIQRAMADMNEMAASMSASIGTSGDTLSRLEEMVETERTSARGRARVARDSVDMTNVILKEGEQKAMADLALAEFAANAGIELQGPIIPKSEQTASAPIEGGITMGPVSQ